MKHAVESPFPLHSATMGKIVDEVCLCGALRSEHEDTLAYGHGPCPDNRCTKFTWAGFVSDDGQGGTAPAGA